MPKKRKLIRIQNEQAKRGKYITLAQAAEMLKKQELESAK